jgi:hypothetical protein
MLLNLKKKPNSSGNSVSKQVSQRRALIPASNISSRLLHSHILLLQFLLQLLRSSCICERIRLWALNRLASDWQSIQLSAFNHHCRVSSVYFDISSGDTDKQQICYWSNSSWNYHPEDCTSHLASIDGNSLGRPRHVQRSLQELFSAHGHSISSRSY